jgi:hypothetical protein
VLWREWGLFVVNHQSTMLAPLSRVCSFLNAKNSDLLLDRYKVPGLESHDFVLMSRVGEVIGYGWMDQGSEFYQSEFPRVYIKVSRL